MSCFSFFPNLIYLSGHILYEKSITQTKEQKIANWHKNGGFSVVFKGKGCNSHMYIKSRIYTANILIVDCLSPFYLPLYFQGLH